MALRDKLRERSQPLLEEGEVIRHVFLAQAWPSAWKPAGPKRVVARLPRQTRFGPLTGLLAKVELEGRALYIHQRFHADADAADAELGGVAGT